MNEGIRSLINAYSMPMPAPEGCTNRDIVRQAINREAPPRIPYSFVHPLKSDFFETAVLRFFMELEDKNSRVIGEEYCDEWNVVQKVTGRDWDHAVSSPLADLSALESYNMPKVDAPKRFEIMKPYIDLAHDQGKYVLADDTIFLFERAKLLMGFEELMMAPYSQPQLFRDLLELLTDLIIRCIERYGEIGNVDGFMTWDDWGLQTSLQVSPDIFREYYKPCYTRITESVHRHGMDFFLHSCGMIMDIIPDIIEMGVDVLQLDQPQLMGHENLADRFASKICFWNTVDIQWSVDPKRTDEDIRQEVASMTRIYGREGGFIARQYPQPEDIGLTPERNMVIYEAFIENGCGL